MAEETRSQEQRRKEGLRKCGMLLARRDYTCARLREKLLAAGLVAVDITAEEFWLADGYTDRYAALSAYDAAALEEDGGRARYVLVRVQTGADRVGTVR